ncbi:MAG: CocE/NonD family hydrolase [Actinomycetota bacterium]
MRTLVRALTALVLLAGLAQAPAGATPIPPLSPGTTDRYEALPMETSMVPTRGGDVYVEVIRPSVPEGTTVPIILTYTPYQLFLQSADDGLADFFVPKGYARALAHVVGTGNSGGCWDYGGRRERDSAYDLVEWLGTRPWSSGRVGMVGGSYDGTTANMAAVETPPHLATIVPEVAIGEWYGYAYHDGVRYWLMDPAQRQGAIIDEQGFDTPLAFDLGLALAPPLNPIDEGYAGRLIERLCPDADKIVHVMRGYDTEADFDAFWRERSYTADAARVEVPVLVQSGWRDYNVKFSESTRWFEALPDDVPTMLLMDQVDHGTPADPGFRWQTVLHAWFDQYLYGIDTKIKQQPRVRSKANDGVIRDDRAWPPAATDPVPLYLRPGGALSPAPGLDGPIGTYADTGLTTESHALTTRGSMGDLLWFESAPLHRDLRIAGEPRLDLLATSSASSTHLTPVLFDLGPPTTPAPQCQYLSTVEACTMGRGFLNARYRNGRDVGQDLVPGQPYRASVRFLGNDWVVKAGHRIGLAMMGSNLWWAVPDEQRATTTLLSGPERRSALILPVEGGTRALREAGL